MEFEYPLLILLTGFFAQITPCFVVITPAMLWTVCRYLG